MLQTLLASLAIVSTECGSMGGTPKTEKTCTAEEITKFDAHVNTLVAPKKYSLPAHVLSAECAKCLTNRIGCYNRILTKDSTSNNAKLQDQCKDEVAKCKPVVAAPKK